MALNPRIKLATGNFSFDGVMHEFFGLAGVVDKATEAMTEAANGLKRVFENRTTSAAS